MYSGLPLPALGAGRNVSTSIHCAFTLPFYQIVDGEWGSMTGRKDSIVCGGMLSRD